MALETATYISDLVSTNPVAGDSLQQADDHLKLIKSTVKATFPNVSGAVTPTHTELNYVDGVTSAIQTQLDGKTTTAYVDAAVTSANVGSWKLIKSTVISGSPSTVDFVNGSGGVVIDGTYDSYLFELLNIQTSAATQLQMRTSTNAGSTFDSGGTDYVQSGGATSSMVLMGNNASIVDGGICGTVHFSNPDSASQLVLYSVAVYRQNGTNLMFYDTRGHQRNTAADVDAIRFFLTSGTFSSGTINLYGRNK